MTDAADGEGGGSDDDQIAACGTGRVAAETHRLRENCTGETGIAAGCFQLSDTVLVMYPEGYGMAVSAQTDCQCGTPRTAADNSRLLKKQESKTNLFKLRKCK